MEVEFCIKAWEQTPEITAQELAQRLLTHFPSTVIDHERGDAYVQAGLDRLIGLGAPDVILDSHRTYFGNVVYASVSEAHWEGGIATSYLHRTWPPLGDTVFFNVEGAKNEALATTIIHELGEALGMTPCSEVTDDA